MRLVWILVVIASCARDVTVRYPSLPDDSTSSVVLLLSEPAENVSVAVNGMLLVEDEHTKRVVIEHVPVGTAEIVMTANGSDKALKVWVEGAHATTVPLGVPAPGGGLFKTLLASVVTVAAYALLR
jgi:hypothetical protein